MNTDTERHGEKETERQKQGQREAGERAGGGRE